MKLGYDNTRTRTSGDVSAAADVARKSELELFAEFNRVDYLAVNNGAFGRSECEAVAY